MRRQRGNTVVGLFLVGLGGWLIAGGLGQDLPNMKQIWPVFPAIIGIAILAHLAASPRSEEGLAFLGMSSLLIGAFLFLFTFDLLAWREMTTYWPAFPLAFGLAFFSVYLAGGMRSPSVLVPTFGVGGLGILAFLFTLGAVENPFLLRLSRLWPVGLLLFGLVFFVRPVQRQWSVRFSKREEQDEQEDELPLDQHDLPTDPQGTDTADIAPPSINEEETE